MHSNVPPEETSINRPQGNLIGGPLPRSSHESGHTLEALDAIRNQVDILRDRQRDSNDAINDLLNRPSAHRHDIIDSQETVFDAIEGHLQRLAAEAVFRSRNSTGARDLNPGLSRGRQTTRNDHAPHPVDLIESSSEAPILDARSDTPPRHYVANLETGPSVIHRSAPFTNRSTRSALTQQLYDILSQPNLLPVLTIEQPPPLISLTYEPAPKPRSASPVTPDSIPRFITSFQSSTPSRLHPSRPRQRPKERIGASKPQEGRPLPINHGPDTSPDDVELERELERVRTARLLAVDRKFVSDTQQLGTSFRQRPRRRHQEPKRGTSTNEGMQMEPHTRDLPGRSSSPLQGARGDTRILASQAIPVEPTFPRDKQRPAAEAGGTAPAEPPRTVPPSSSWYHRSSHSQSPPHSTPQPTTVQFPPEPLDRAIELLQDIRLGQRAVAEQQRKVTQYMRGLNSWLERAVHDRRLELSEMDMQLGRLHGDIERVAGDCIRSALPG